MDCTPFRETLSAGLDGEPGPVPAAALDAHLDGCPACQAWLSSARALTRAVRVTPAEPVPDLTAAILAAAAPSAARRPAPSPTAWRIALVALAASHLALAVPGLLDAAAAGTAAHRASELGAFDAALALGFLLAAWRPWRAEGMAPLVGLAVAGLLATSTAGIIAGRTDLLAEAPHLLDILGVVALVAIGRALPGARIPRVRSAFA